MFRLPRRFADEMIRHAREEAPNEACGLLAGRDGRLLKLFKTRNAEQSPSRFLVDPREQLDIFLEMDKRGWELIAIYHSHISSPAYPSQTDIDLAYYQDALHLIVSLSTGTRPDIRAFRIVNGEVREEEMVIVEERRKSQGRMNRSTTSTNS